MCYCGCSYENRNGGCGKPFNKICPQIADEIKDFEDTLAHHIAEEEGK